MRFNKTFICIVTFFVSLLGAGNCLAQQNEPSDEERADQILRVKFTGNETFAAVVLKDQIASEAPSIWEKLRFWKDTGYPVEQMMIKKDVVRLSNFYQRRGFYNVNISYRLEEMGKPWKKKLIFEIEENSAIRISQLNYQFETDTSNIPFIKESNLFQVVQNRQPFQPGRRYERILIPDAVGQINDAIRNLGFPYADVSVDAEVDTAALSALVTITCNTGPRADVSEIDVKGVKSIDEDYVIKQSGIKIGENYSLEKIQDAQRELFNHHLFQFVTIGIPEQEQDSTLNLLMTVREASLRTVEASVGFSTADLARGQVRWIHRNVFNEGHRFTATGRVSFIQQLLSFDYLFPYFYNNKSSIIISPFAEHQLEKSFELFTGGVTNSFIYQHRKNITGTISYELTKNLELSQQPDVSLPDSTTRYDLSSLQLSGYYSQGFGREQLGWVVQPYLEISGFFGFASYQFQKASLDVRRFTKLGKSTVLATRVQAGGLVNASTDSLPRNIRFFLGGTGSVRGWYRQNLGPKEASFRPEYIENPDGTVTDTVSVFDGYIPVGGRAKFAFNIELRQDLNRLLNGFGITAFLDGGQVWRGVTNISDRPIQFSAGGGFRYRSPIGPVRIDLGYKLNPTEQDLGVYPGEDPPNFWDKVGIHFSIGQAF